MAAGARRPGRVAVRERRPSGRARRGGRARRRVSGSQRAAAIARTRSAGRQRPERRRPCPDAHSAAAPGLAEPAFGGRNRAPRGGRMSLRRLRDRNGQAAVEMMGALPVVLLLGLVVLQLLAVGYASVIAGQAAESAALALAGGGDAEEAARAAVPGWSRTRMQIEVRGGRVTGSMRRRAAIDAVARKLEVHAGAEVRAP